MTNWILFTGVVILLCLLLNRIADKIGIPVLLAFILLGMFFGVDGFLKIPFDSYEMAEQVCTAALIFIMFYGGFGTNWKQAKAVAREAVLLSTAGVFLTAMTTGLFSYFVLKISFWESILIGSVISSTDAASVFSILRSKHLNLKDNTASLLEVESGSNDPCSYMMTVLTLGIMSGDFSGGKLVGTLVLQIGLGLLIGAVVALLAEKGMKVVKMSSDGYDTIFVFCVALLAYAVASAIGGNGYLSTYIAGIILGNKPLRGKKSLVHFFDGLTGLMQMLIFFLLGLLAYPSRLPEVAGIALLIALFLTFVARPFSVFAILTPFKCSFRQKLLVSWCGLRGAASIVFAIMATVSPAYTKNDLFHIVIFIVLFSISLQGSLLSFMSKKLNMIDDSNNVMKTFSDYSEEMPVEFVEITIKDRHPWANRMVKDVPSMPDLLMVLILRGKEKLIPKGNTVLLPGDVVVLSALSPEGHLGVCLTEIEVDQDSKWAGKPLSKIKLGEEKLVLVLKRGERVLIPNGSTVVEENDILVISQL